ncbi:unnamed protein product [Trichogramma brassicae]|uniref:Uncharacterized protein n=1 Tax=Trichogramma brassicae TaxID=86971 RepID=A0A6H5IXK8_9HYME|nr:unnamed protein product [Trichogramma brassicae]
MFESLSKAINNTLLSRLTNKKNAQSGAAITFIRQRGYWPLRAVRVCICTMEPMMEAFRYFRPEIGLTHCDLLRSNYASCTRKKQRSPRRRRRRRRSLAPRVLTFVRGSTCAMCTTTLDALLQFPSRRN